MSLLSLESLTEDQLLRQILAASSDLIFVKDQESRIIWANRAFCAFCGMTLEELRGRINVDRNEAHTSGYLTDDARVLRQAETVDIPEEAAVRCDGQTRWLHTVKTPLLDAAGRATMLVGVARDVTEQRAAGLALKRLNECLLASGPDSIANISRLTALCGELLGADRAVYNRLDKGILTAIGQWNVPPDFNPIIPIQGTPCETVVARACDDPIVVAGLHNSPGNAQQMRTYIGRVVKAEDRVLGSLYVLFRRDAVADAVLAKVMGILASAIAAEEGRLSAEKTHARLSEELRQANKMEAIGRLAGAVAHDFNNALTAIKGYAEILESSATSPGQRADASEIVNSADFAASLTRQLLSFGRRQRLVPRTIDLNETLAATARMLKRLIGANIELLVPPPRGQTRVYADPGQMEQILINLALNARDAMTEGGKLTLSLAEVAADVVPAGDGPPPSGRYVELTVADTGRGIAPEILPHIFEPFFTTKEPGKGTGLGLATVYGIVLQSGGRISCDSAPGRGATFRVHLPLCRAPLAPEPEPPRSSPTPGHGAVLLVEDDASIRRMCARILRASGYAVTEASDSAEALRLVADSNMRLDALITDVVMPGLNGRQLAAHIEREHPGLKVLYMSGYTDDAVFHNVLKPGTAFLQKPFNPADLCRKLLDILPN